MSIERGEWVRIANQAARLCGIYAIVHRNSGGAYIGSSHHIGKRWTRHVARLTAGTHHSPKLCEAWLSDGPTAFDFVVLEQCDVDQLVTREQAWVDVWSGTVFNVGKIVASPMRGATHSETTKRRLSEALRGGTRSMEWRARVSAALMGHPVSEEARAKMRESHLGARLSPLVIARRSASYRANWRPPTAESTAKRIATRLARGGFIVSPAHRERISQANRGRKHTAEARARMSIAMTESWSRRKDSRP